MVGSMFKYLEVPFIPPLKGGRQVRPPAAGRCQGVRILFAQSYLFVKHVDVVCVFVVFLEKCSAGLEPC